MRTLLLLVFLVCLCVVRADPWLVVPIERAKALMGKMSDIVTERIYDIETAVATAAGRVEPAMGELDDRIAQELARGVADDYEANFRAFAAAQGFKVPTSYPVFDANGGLGIMFPVHCTDLRYGRYVMQRFAELWTETLQQYGSLGQPPAELIEYVIMPITHMLCQTHHEEGLLPALVDFTHRSAILASVAKQ